MREVTTMETLRHKQVAARKSAAARYESAFGKPLAERIAELLTSYPEITAPNWISWEGHKFTNAATSRALKTWLADISS